MSELHGIDTAFHNKQINAASWPIDIVNNDMDHAVLKLLSHIIPKLVEVLRNNPDGTTRVRLQASIDYIPEPKDHT